MPKKVALEWPRRGRARRCRGPPAQTIPCTPPPPDGGMMTLSPTAGVAVIAETSHINQLGSSSHAICLTFSGPPSDDERAPHRIPVRRVQHREPASQSPAANPQGSVKSASRPAFDRLEPNSLCRRNFASPARRLSRPQSQAWERAWKRPWISRPAVPREPPPSGNRVRGPCRCRRRNRPWRQAGREGAMSRTRGTDERPKAAG